MSRYLTARQRDEAPIDKHSARRGRSAGGYDTVSPVRTLAVGIQDERPRYPGTVFDGGIVRDRGPYFQRPRFTPAAPSWVNWTEAGPLRAELNMRNVTYRTEAGSSRSRFPVVDTPTTGMHTMGVSGVSRTVPRYVETPQMTAGRPFRLSSARYQAQTYSQTTVHQGRGRR